MVLISIQTLTLDNTILYLIAIASIPHTKSRLRHFSPPIPALPYPLPSLLPPPPPSHAPTRRLSPVHQRVEQVVVDPVAGLIQSRPQLEGAQHARAVGVVLLEHRLPDADAAPESLELFQAEFARVVDVHQRDHRAGCVLTEALELEL